MYHRELTMFLGKGKTHKRSVKYYGSRYTQSIDIRNFAPSYFQICKMDNCKRDSLDKGIFFVKKNGQIRDTRY